jgi:hypothetical protein
MICKTKMVVRTLSDSLFCFASVADGGRFLSDRPDEAPFSAAEKRRRLVRVSDGDYDMLANSQQPLIPSMCLLTCVTEVALFHAQRPPLPSMVGVPVDAPDIGYSSSP